MAKAVIFDMYETLITHYRCPQYFGSQIAVDCGIEERKFRAYWDTTESDRTVGKTTFEDVISHILSDNNLYSAETFNKVVSKRTATKVECFNHLHDEILPMLTEIKKRGIKIGLISNCFSEEVGPIKNSALFPYFDAAFLSYEQKMQKPDTKIFTQCVSALEVSAQECVYIGDGGSFELETARSLGMLALQSVWYVDFIKNHPSRRMKDFPQLEKPMDVLKFI